MMWDDVYMYTRFTEQIVHKSYKLKRDSKNVNSKA